MFCDLVGSTALSPRLDAEELRDLSGRHPAEGEMRSRLLDWEGRRTPERPRGLEPSTSELDRLRDLGYVE